MAEAAKSYPVTLTVDYPDRDLNRLTTFFRSILFIPAGVIRRWSPHPYGAGARGEARTGGRISGGYSSHPALFSSSRRSS